MSNVAVIGSQWGDEGKGKIVDWLSEKADVIAKISRWTQCRSYTCSKQYYL